MSALLHATGCEGFVLDVEDGRRIAMIHTPGDDFGGIVVGEHDSLEQLWDALVRSWLGGANADLMIATYNRALAHAALKAEECECFASPQFVANRIREMMVPT